MKIVIVEDDPGIRKELKQLLENAFYEAEIIEEFKDTAEQICSMIPAPDLVLLDWNLPGESGFDICTKLKEHSDIPIIFLTSRTDSMDELTGILKGADDYITKPFSVEELLARIRVSQRRLAITQSGKQPETSVFENGGLKIDYTAGCTFLKDRELHLTPIEYKLLCLLSRNVGKVLTHTYITQQIWGRCSENDVASLRVFMATLRKKLELEKNGVQYIQTHIGIGYRMLRIEKPEQETKKDSINPQTII